MWFALIVMNEVTIKTNAKIRDEAQESYSSQCFQNHLFNRRSKVYSYLKFKRNIWKLSFRTQVLYNKVSTRPWMWSRIALFVKISLLTVNSKVMIVWYIHSKRKKIVLKPIRVWNNAFKIVTKWQVWWLNSLFVNENIE